MVHYSLAEESVNLNNYNILPSMDTPYIFLGTIVKHRYDEDRLRFNHPNVKCIRVNDTAIRGVFLNVKSNSNFDLLLKQLKLISDKDLSTDFYERVLNTFNLSSSECYGNLKRGIYPINGNHVSQLTNSGTSISTYYEQLFDTTGFYSWQGLSHLTLFVLINKS